mgnify:CR=1 FL=1
MRKLVSVPVVHSVQDLGQLGHDVRESTVHSQGVESWHRKERAIANYWDRIEKKIHELGLEWKKVRIYQDGLPVCEHEQEIAQDVAQKGSRNHELLLQLVDKGATLMGTESPDLLLQEYSNLQQGLHQSRSEEQAKESADILRARDVFIAERINATLGLDETGLVFVGKLHDFIPYLAEDIKVQQMNVRA